MRWIAEWSPTSDCDCEQVELNTSKYTHVWECNNNNKPYTYMSVEQQNTKSHDKQRQTAPTNKNYAKTSMIHFQNIYVRYD